MPQQTWYELYERLDALALAMAQQWFESDDDIYRTPAYSEFCYIRSEEFFGIESSLASDCENFFWKGFTNYRDELLLVAKTGAANE